MQAHLGSQPEDAEGAVDRRTPFVGDESTGVEKPDSVENYHRERQENRQAVPPGGISEPLCAGSPYIISQSPEPWHRQPGISQMNEIIRARLPFSSFMGEFSHRLV